MDIINGKQRPGLGVSPDKVDQYMKETFGLTDQELAELGRLHQEDEAKRKLPRPQNRN